MHNSSNKFHKDIPIVRESPHIPKTYSETQHHTIDQAHLYEQKQQQQSPPRTYQEYPYPPPDHYKPAGSRYQNEFNSNQQGSP